MYRFAGYGLRVNDDISNVLAKDKNNIIEIMRQQGLKESDVVRLFYFEVPKYVEPKENVNEEKESL